MASPSCSFTYSWIISSVIVPEDTASTQAPANAYPKTSSEGVETPAAALVQVNDATDAKRALDRLTPAKQDAAGHRCTACEFFPTATSAQSLHYRDIRAKLALMAHLRACVDGPAKANCQG